jgi:hypothetical protein
MNSKTHNTIALCLIGILLMNASAVFCQKTYKAPATVKNPKFGGQWEPGGCHKELPLTTVVKWPGWTYDSWRANVGDKLIKNGGGNIFNVQYTALKSKADGLSSPDSKPKDASKRAQMNMEFAQNAKKAAFIYFLNVDITSTTTYSTFSSGARNAYRDKAIAYLNAIDYSTGWMGLSQDLTQYESKALIMALEAFDLLQSANAVAGGSVDNDWINDEKLDLQYLAKNLYNIANSILFGVFSDNNNLTLMTSGALSLAAIVLHDCGGDWTLAPWTPDRWANRANYEIQNTLFESSTSQCGSDGSAGYNEGPHYFHYAFENLMPFFIAYTNYLPGDFTRGFKNTIIFGSWRNMQAPLYSASIKNVFDWYARLVLPSGLIAPIDDAFNWQEYGDLLGCYFKLNEKNPNNTGPNQPFNWMDGKTGQENTDLDVEYIANGNPPQVGSNQPDFTFCHGNIGELQNAPAGTISDDRIQLIALGSWANDPTRAHKHSDFGSFIISAGQDQLIIDPGMIDPDAEAAWNVFNTFIKLDKSEQHNVITARNVGTAPFTGPIKSEFGVISDISTVPSEPDSRQFLLVGTYHDQNIYVQRHFIGHNIPGLYYYEVRDAIISNAGTNKDIKLNINGAGNRDNSSFTFPNHGDDHVFDYIYRCNDNQGGVHWGIRCVVAVKGGGPKDTVTHSGDYSTLHCDDVAVDKTHPDGFICDWTGRTNSTPFGFHTRYEARAENTKYAEFLSVFIPFKCGTTPPSVWVETETPHNIIHIKTSNGTQINLVQGVVLNHGSHTDISQAMDSIGLTGNIEYNSKSINSNFSATAAFQDNYCTAYTHFRSISIDSGDYFRFQDTTYIASDSFVDAGYSIVGRCRYKAAVTNNSGASAHVTFYLPDTLYNGHFIAFDANTGNIVTSSWDSLNKKIMITCPEGYTEFYIQLDNPCQLNCFFPPTAKTIDNVFNFDNGLTEYLDHDLDIKADSGRLNILAGSIMSICSRHYLTNQDTLYIRGNMDANDSFTAIRRDSCAGDVVSTVFPYFHNTGRLNSGRSMIIVNYHAALVLQTGSNTFLDANSTILVKKGGTLYIQNGARVTIGGASGPGYAEIVAEDSSFICIETPVDYIKFYANLYDSTDKNILYLPVGFRGKYCNAGRFSDVPMPWIFDGGGRYSSSPACISICSLKDNLVVQNPAYGWFNAGYPHGHIDMPDTICYGDPIIASTRYSQNVSRFKMQVCTSSAEDGGGISCTDLVTCDTGRLDWCNLTAKYTWLADHNYTIVLKVFNECGDSDTTSKNIYVISKPTASFTIPDSACPGIGTFTANGSASAHYQRHSWVISAVEPDRDVPEPFDTIFRSGSDTLYTYSSSVSSSFGFPGFLLKGGRKYAITLRTFNYCGVVEQTKLINIPLEATILNRKPELVYGNSIGPASVILRGRVAGASSHVWKYKPSGGSFTDVSDSTDIDITVSPTVPTIYVLKATNGSCIETDTIVVNINLYANVGKDTAICKGDSAYIGVSGVSLPSGYTAKWRSHYHVKDTTTTFTKAAPDSTVRYTLSIYNGSTFVEIDDKTVYVDTIPDVNYLTTYSGEGFKICFTNESVPWSPLTKYLWTFGDGDSSRFANPCHRYAYVGHDTFYNVCLKVTNACGDSTLCDSMFIPADSNTLFSMRPNIVKNNRILISPKFGEMQTVTENPIINKSLQILKIVPNPTSGKATIYYSLDPGTDRANLMIYEMQGKIAAIYKLAPDKNNLEIDLSNTKSGIYSGYIITDKNISKTLKIVIAR